MSRCSNWIPSASEHKWRSHARCEGTAEVALLDPDGKLTPGVRICAKCAEEIVTEYREKLGQEWKTVPLDGDGSTILRPEDY